MQAWNFIKKDSKTGVFLWSLRNFKNIFFHRTVPVAVSAIPVAASVFFFLKKYYWRALSQPCYDVLIISSSRQIFWCFFSVWVFFHEDSRITGEREGQRKGKGIFLTPHYHFRPLHGHLDISRAITAESSPVHIASSRALTGNLCFPSASS